MMLRVLMTLECDRCKRSYHHASVSAKAEISCWEAEVDNLKLDAGYDGWYTESAEIVCRDCMCEELMDEDDVPLICRR